MFYNCGNNIYAVDARYKRERNTAVYIIRDKSKAAIVDTASNASLPYVLAAMKELGIEKKDISYIFLTHVHLDHAGGAGLYMKEFPAATLVVHSRGVRHMIAPGKLIASVKSVYGEAEYKKLYGEITPVDPDRIISAGDGYEFCVGERHIKCLSTPGHAKHHLSYLDIQSSSVFAGDSFGTSYPEMQTINGRWVIPSTSPVQFSPEDMHKSIDYTMSFNPEHIYLAHFGELTGFRQAVNALHQDIDTFVKYAESVGGIKTFTEAKVHDFFIRKAMLHKIDPPLDFVDFYCAHLTDLNAQGLNVWYKGRERRVY